MAGKSQSVKTTLSVRDCAEIFNELGPQLNSGWRGLTGAISSARGMGNSGFFTPDASNDPFGQFTRRPDFSVGVAFSKFSAGASGNVDAVHMYVYDEGDHRVVELFSPHGILGGGGAIQRLTKFVSALVARDPQAQVSMPE